MKLGAMPDMLSKIKLILQEIFEEITISNYIPDRILKYIRIYPTEVNFPVTTKCNAKCIMCNIWKEKEKVEITPEQVRSIFSNDLFRNVVSVGVTGGEPTMRDDLGELVEKLCMSLPNLKSINLTTNGINTKRVVNTCKNLNSICKTHDVQFGVSVSLDGIGEIHEYIRGVPKSFLKTKETIYELKKISGIGVSVGSTICKYNYSSVNDVLDWCIKNDVYCMFRLATIIERLHNKNCEDNMIIDKCAKEYLIDFFLKLSQMRTITYERKLHYRQLADIMRNNCTRKFRCVFITKGVVVDSHGDMFYCTVSSRKIGNVLESSAHDIYFNFANLRYRKWMYKNRCPHCIHDYLVHIPLKNRLVNKISIYK